MLLQASAGASNLKAAEDAWEKHRTSEAHVPCGSYTRQAVASVSRGMLESISAKTHNPFTIHQWVHKTLNASWERKEAAVVPIEPVGRLL